MQVQYQAIVFESTTDDGNFSCSERIVLPGLHTRQRAWQLVREELRGPRAASLIGGGVRPWDQSRDQSGECRGMVGEATE